MGLSIDKCCGESSDDKLAKLFTTEEKKKYDLNRDESIFEASDDEKKDDSKKEQIITYTLTAEDENCILDVKKITSKDVKFKNLSTSYITEVYDSPGSLTLNTFVTDDGGNLVEIIFDVTTPAKSTKDNDKIDDKNTYKIKVKSDTIGDQIDLTKQTTVLLDESLQDNEYPTKIEDKKKYKSLMAKYCTKELFNKYKDIKTKNGFTFGQCINTGVKNPRSIMGCHAGDIESYDIYSELFNSVIKDYHNFDVKNKSQDQSTMDADELTYTLSDKAKELIQTTRIRVARNLDGYNLAPGQQSLKEKKDVESVFINVFKYINETDDEIYKDFKGKYYPLYDITEEERQEFIKGHFLFKGNDKMQVDSGYHKWFPNARGIYFNNDKTFLCWINEGDHIRLISMEKGGDVKSVYNRLANACNIFEDIIVKQKYGKGNGFLKSEKLGNITCCPTNLGTGLRGGVHIKLNNLSGKTIDDLNDTAIQYHCQIRGIHGEHSKSEGGILDISNKYRLGYSENELVSMMINGVNKFVEMEEMEETIDDQSYDNAFDDDDGL